MRWNLRLAAANRGIWKASELQRMLAERELVISAGKMSGLWSGQPASVKLEDLDVICAVLGCGPEELLVPEPDKVPQPQPGADQSARAQAATAAPAPGRVTPKRRDGRSRPRCDRRRDRVSPRRGFRKGPSSCEDCLAWGVLSGRCCTACYVFRRTYPGQDECAGCGRTVAVRKGYCRLCWNQARANARARATGQPHGTAKVVYFLDTVGAYQQLFFAGMFITQGARTTPPTQHTRRGRPPTPPPAPAGRPRSRWTQLRLFADVRRDFTRFNDDHADPDNPWQAWARYLAHRRGEARGWRPEVHAQVRRALVIVLSGFAEGDTVRYSDLAPAMLALGSGPTGSPRSWRRWASWSTTAGHPSPTGWNASSTGLPRASANPSRHGCAPCTTEDPAPRPDTPTPPGRT